MSNKIEASLGEIMRVISPAGDPNTAIAANLYGINHRLTQSPIPVSREHHGLVFFTRPQLNLSDENIRAVRQLIPLLTTEPVSIQRMVRKLLDPRQSKLQCPLVDDKMAFIPILTNHINSFSGFPDPFLNMHVSKPGQYKESFGYVDDTYKRYDNFDVSATFRNMPGDPISLIFNVWNIYMAAVFENVMSPYPDFIARRTIDYNTRIYRVGLCRNRRFVVRLACTGASNPKSVPLGSLSDFSSDEPLNMNGKSISIQFPSFGARYQDPIIVHDFNKTVGIFNPDMREVDNDVPDPQSVTKIPYHQLRYFNNRGYPRINTETMELEWWLPNEVYEFEAAKLQSTFNALSRGVIKE